MTDWLVKIGLVAAGGAGGAVCRWGLSWGTQHLFHRATASTVPVGTLVTNAVGCLVIGLAVAWLEQRTHLRNELQLLWITGFLGAFTTFSTYAFEAVQHGKGGAWVGVALHVLAHNVVGVALVVVGMAIGATWFKSAG